MVFADSIPVRAPFYDSFCTHSTIILFIDESSNDV
jgi:hypothetical protein